MAGAVLLFVPQITWPCPLRVGLGIPCPTCGITRATRLLFHGDFAGATHMHPLVWVILPFIAVFLVAEVRGYWKTHAWGAASRLRGAPLASRIVLAAVVIVWVARFLGAF